MIQHDYETSTNIYTRKCHDSDAILARHIARFGAIVTRCGSDMSALSLCHDMKTN